MRGSTVRCVLAALLLAAIWGTFGCGKKDGAPPIADLTGAWEGEAKDPSVSGNYYDPIQLNVFSQDGNTITGISSLQGLARFTGYIDGDILTIEGTDIYAKITADGTRIDGTYTTVDGLTAPFWLERVS